MIEDSDGNYNESSTSSFPSYDYYYNHTKSSCIDLTGKEIENSLLYNQDSKTVTVTIGETTGCYLYFDNWEEVSSFANDLIDSGNLWQSGLEDDGYRYVGTGSIGTNTNPNNFICFGTSVVSECTANQDKYMYRIIGVFSDENGINHIKLIKYKQLSSASWNSLNVAVPWSDADLYKKINGDNFLTNTTYDYLQDASWSNKISNWNWLTVNTNTYTNNGANYYNSLNLVQVYLHEMNRSTKTTTIGEWTNAIGKIGLMYASDYLLSIGEPALTMTHSNNEKATLQTSWLHPYYNDKTEGSTEWTISEYGVNVSSNLIWYIHNKGHLSFEMSSLAKTYRPVFYLSNGVSLVNGTGTINDPFIISEDYNEFSVNVTKKSNMLIANITKGKGNPIKYCINSNKSIASCTWNNITSTTINYTMSEEGTYYVHVIDDAGYIVHGSIKYILFASELIKSNVLWQSGLEGDGYRYIGTNPDNYVCFGTANKSDCTTNQDKYMYRIIGVFDNHIKLIKYKKLGSYNWSSNVDVNLGNSTIYSNLNGSYFLTNTTYIPNDAWKSKIENWTWSAVNTNASSTNLDYYYTSSKEIYLHEMNRNSKENDVGSWTTPSGKIGLIYVSDYVLSLGESSLEYTSKNNLSTLKTGWMHLSNNDSTSSYDYEWTITRAGLSSGTYGVYRIHYNGGVGTYGANNAYVVRPVFYLTSDVELSSGTGTLSDPYIIDN